MLRTKRDFDHTDMYFAAAYSRVDTRAVDVQYWIDRTFAKFGRHMTYVDPVEFSVIARANKDIDSLIVNDMWKSVVNFEKSTLEKAGMDVYPLQMRFVLFSGDGDYLDTYDAIQDAFGERLELELIVYAWREKLNTVLRRMASEVRYLDDIPDLFLQNEPQRTAP